MLNAAANGLELRTLGVPEGAGTFINSSLLFSTFFFIQAAVERNSEELDKPDSDLAEGSW